MQSHFAEFQAAGAEVLAVTGELPEHLEAAGPNLARLDFPILYDEGFKVIKEYGLAYDLVPALDEVYKEKGLDLAAANGTEQAMLPIPATYVIQPDGVVSAAWVEVDHTTRPEVADVLAALKD